MTTPVWITGFEHGLAAPVTSGGGIATVIAGSPSIQSTIKRSGTYALRISAASTSITKSITSDYQVGSIYIYFVDALPNGDAALIYAANTDGAMGIWYNSGDSKLHAYKSVAGTDIAGPTVTYNTWYRIDYRFYTNATTHTIDWQVDGNDQTQLSVGSRSAVTMISLRLGVGAISSINVVFDDVVVSTTSADYPIGAHAVEGLRPSGDGTHNNAANIMEDSAGNDIDGSTYYAYDKLDEDPWTSTANADYVRQTGNGTGNYCEINFADTSNTTILGVMALLEYASETATANNGGCIIIDEDATATTLWGAPGGNQSDYSETSAFYKSVILPAPAGGWDQAAVNAIKCRFGYSGDANPDPYWLAIMLEVAYVSGAGTSKSVSDDGTAVDDVSQILASLGLMEVGSGIDSPEVSALLGIIDTALGGDYLDLFAGLNITETGIGIDALSQILASLSTSESGSANDLSSILASLSVSDAGSGLESINVLTTSLKTLLDTGLGSDQISVSVGLSLQDTGSGTDTLSIQVSLQITDTGLGADTISVIAFTLKEITDLAFGIDGVDIAASLNIGETSYGIDDPAILALLELLENGAGLDTPDISASLTITDTSSATDIISILQAFLVLISDIGSGNDVITNITASIPVAESGIGSDAIGQILASLLVTDFGEGVDVVIKYDTSANILKIEFILNKPRVTFAMSKPNIWTDLIVPNIVSSDAEPTIDIELLQPMVKFSLKAQ